MYSQNYLSKSNFGISVCKEFLSLVEEISYQADLIDLHVAKSQTESLQEQMY